MELLHLDSRRRQAELRSRRAFSHSEAARGGGQWQTISPGTATQFDSFSLENSARAAWNEWHPSRDVAVSLSYPGAGHLRSRRRADRPGGGWPCAGLRVVGVVQLRYPPRLVLLVFFLGSNVLAC